MSRFFRNGSLDEPLLDLAGLSMIKGISKLKDLKSYTLTANQFLTGQQLPTSNYSEILVTNVPLPTFIESLKWESPEVKSLVYQIVAGIRPSSLLDITLVDSDKLPHLSDQDIESPRLIIKEGGELYFESEYEVLIVSQKRVRKALLTPLRRILGF